MAGSTRSSGPGSGAEVVGVHVAPVAIELARRRGGRPAGLRFEVADVLEGGFDRWGRFDLVTVLGGVFDWIDRPTW